MTKELHELASHLNSNGIDGGHVVKDAALTIERLHCLIQAAPDPAFYKPEELAGAWEKWHGAVKREMSVGSDSDEG